MRIDSKVWGWLVVVALVGCSDSPGGGDEADATQPRRMLDMGPGGAGGEGGAGGADGEPDAGSDAGGGGGGAGGGGAGGGGAGGGGAGGGGAGGGGAGGGGAGGGGAGGGGMGGGGGGGAGGGGAVGGMGGMGGVGGGPAPPPAAGEIVFTEIMWDTELPLVDEQSEWFEITNVADGARNLEGCTFRDAANGASRVGAVTIAPGDHLVFARSDDAARNGGLPVAGVFTFGLNNSGRETLTLDCGAGAIDVAGYTVADLGNASGRSLALDPARTTAADNDDPLSWCLSTVPYFEGREADNRGSPGVANPPCPVPDPCDPNPCDPAEMCVEGVCVPPEPEPPVTGAVVFTEVMHSPAAPIDDAGQWFELANTTDAPVDLTGCTVTVDAGEGFEVARAIPARGRLVYAASDVRNVNGGLTPDGTFPFQLQRADSLTLNCFDVVIDVVAWDDGGDFPVAEGASLSLDAASTSANANDDGARWCLGRDRYGEGQLGTPGEANPPCAGAPGCMPACGRGEVCSGGECVPPPERAPGEGEVIFSEIMYDPDNGLDDDRAEWIELQSLVDEPLGLAGCVVTDAGGGRAALDGGIDARGRFVIARVADPARNGGVVAQGTFGFSLNNSPETVTLRCGETVVDAVRYEDGGTFPRGRGASIGLDPERFDAEQNNLGASWCLGQVAYTPAGAGANLGSPGALNPSCEPADPCDPDPCAEGERCVGGDCVAPPPPPVEGDVVFSEVLYSPADPVGVEGHWFELTSVAAGDRDLLGCTVRALSGGALPLSQVLRAGGRLVFARSDDAARNGGLDDPADVFAFDLAAEDLLSLVCGDTVIDLVLWDDGDELPAAHGASISLDPAHVDAADNDDGRNWCVGTSRYGDGSQRGTPGAANTACPLRCEPACAGGDVCVGGVCGPPAPRVPAEGELVFTEIMYDPEGGLAENAAEWIELTSVADQALDLATCALTDAGGSRSVLQGALAPGAIALFARSADPMRNGGLAVLGTFTVSLNNGVETLTVTCGGTVVDSVRYDDGGAFPTGTQRSIALDPAHVDAADNDAGANWCGGVEIYTLAGATEHRGTPGRPNPVCAPPQP